MRTLPLLLAAACGLSLPAQAAVYSCINAKGEKSISDKPCAPTQTTQRIYSAPRPASTEDFVAPSPGSSVRSPLMPQTPEEIEAMLRARERAAQGLPAEGSAEERAWLDAIEQQKQDRKRQEPRRQMENYLQQKDQQRQEWRGERQDGARTGYYEEAAQERRRQKDCASLQQRKNGYTTAAREAFSRGSPASRASNIDAEREVSRQMNENGCN